MEYRFKAEEWKSLTPQQRASRCRLMAGEARALADEAAADMKLCYLKIADDWMRLAEEIERGDSHAGQPEGKAEQGETLSLTVKGV